MDALRRQDEVGIPGWFIDGDYVVRVRGKRAAIVGPIGEQVIEVLLVEERDDEGLIFAGESLVHPDIWRDWTRTEVEAEALDALDAEVA